MVKIFLPWATGGIINSNVLNVIHGAQSDLLRCGRKLISNPILEQKLRLVISLGEA